MLSSCVQLRFFSLLPSWCGVPYIDVGFMYYSHLSSWNKFLPVPTRHPVFVAASDTYIKTGRQRRLIHRARAGEIQTSSAEEAKTSKCFGPSQNSTTERDVSVFPFIAEMKIYVLWVFHTNESLSMQRPYMSVVIVRWQVVVLVFPWTSLGLGRYCPPTALLLALVQDLQTWYYGAWWVSSTYLMC